MRPWWLLLLALNGTLAAAEPGYPLWDNAEPVPDYAKIVNLPPTQTIDLPGGVKLELDYCMGYDRSDCAQRACTEVRAYSVGGFCDRGGNPGGYEFTGYPNKKRLRKRVCYIVS